MIALLMVFAAILALAKPGLRIWACLAGALLTLDTGGGSPLKMAFAGLLSVSLFLAWRNPSEMNELRSTQRRRIKAASVVFILWLCLVTSLQAHFSGDRLADWARHALVVALPALMAPIAVAEARFQTRRSLNLGLVLLTIIASIQFMATWIGRRNLASDISNEAYFGLGSKALLASLLALCFVAAVASPKWPERIGWLILACLPISSILATGTRSGLILVVIPAACLVSMKMELKRRGLVILALGLVGSYWLLVNILAKFTQEGFVADRIGSVAAVLSGDQLIDDAFTSGRLSIQEISREVFYANPVLGVGGINFTYVDSAWVPLAQFGVIGTLVILYFLAKVLYACWAVTQPGSPGRSIVLGFATYLIAVNAVSTPIADQGIGIAIALVILNNFNADSGSLSGVTFGSAKAAKLSKSPLGMPSSTKARLA